LLIAVKFLSDDNLFYRIISYRMTTLSTPTAPLAMSTKFATQLKRSFCLFYFIM